MNNLFYSLISSNIETDNYLLLRKIIINNVFLMVASIVLTISTFVNAFIFAQYDIAIINTISAFTSFYAIYNLKKTKKIKIAQIISSLNIFLFFLFFAYLNQNHNFGFIWTIFAPIFLIPILGHKKGTLVTLLFYSIFYILAYSNIGIWQSGEWTLHSFVRLVASSLVLTYITYVNEHAIFKANKRLKEKEEEEKKYVHQIITARDSAIKAEESKDIFLANMSHEIRTPLNAILGFVKILEKEIKDETQKKYLSIVKNSSDSLLSIIGDILDFAKLRAGKIDIIKKPHNLSKEVELVYKLFSKNAEVKKIHFTLKNSSLLDNYFEIDKVRINQIISNLLSNAIKFTPENANILLSADLKENNILSISVKDSGIGMTEEQQINIFNSFEQAKNDTSHQYGGTGLGLTISLKLAKLMNGTLTVTSELGKGSIFTLNIPVNIVENIDEDDAINSFQKNNPIFHGNILVAEDNKTNQLLIDILLKEYKLNVVMTNDGQEVCDVYEQSSHQDNKFDMILMDNNMPKMNGIEACKKIKQLECYYKTPIVALTANALNGDREFFLNQGMDEYLKKPIEEIEIQKILRKFL